MGAAKARRYRRATAVCSVTGVFLAGIFGGLAMGGVSGVQHRVETVAQGIGLGVPTTVSALGRGHQHPGVVPKRSTPGKTKQPPPLDRDRPGHQRPAGRAGEGARSRRRPDGGPGGGDVRLHRCPGGRQLRPVGEPGGCHGGQRSLRRAVHRRRGPADSLAAQRPARPDRRRTLGRDLRVGPGVQPQGSSDGDDRRTRGHRAGTREDRVRLRLGPVPAVGLARRQPRSLGPVVGSEGGRPLPGLRAAGPPDGAGSPRDPDADRTAVGTPDQGRDLLLPGLPHPHRHRTGRPARSRHRPRPTPPRRPPPRRRRPGPRPAPPSTDQR